MATSSTAPTPWSFYLWQRHLNPHFHTYVLLKYSACAHPTCTLPHFHTFVLCRYGVCQDLDDLKDTYLGLPDLLTKVGDRRGTPT